MKLFIEWLGWPYVVTAGTSLAVSIATFAYVYTAGYGFWWAWLASIATGYVGSAVCLLMFFRRFGQQIESKPKN